MPQLHQYNQPLWASSHPHYKEQLYPNGNICISISHAKELYAVYMSKKLQISVSLHKQSHYFLNLLAFVHHLTEANRKDLFVTQRCYLVHHASG